MTVFRTVKERGTCRILLFLLNFQVVEDVSVLTGLEPKIVLFQLPLGRH